MAFKQVAMRYLEHLKEANSRIADLEFRLEERDVMIEELQRSSSNEKVTIAPNLQASENASAPPPAHQNPQPTEGHSYEEKRRRIENDALTRFLSSSFSASQDVEDTTLIRGRADELRMIDPELTSEKRKNYELSQQLAALQEEIGKSEATNRELQTSLNNSQLEIRDLKDLVEETEYRLEFQKTVAEGWKDAHSALEREGDNARSEFTELEAQLARERSQVSELESLIRGFQERERNNSSEEPRRLRSSSTQLRSSEDQEVQMTVAKAQELCQKVETSVATLQTDLQAAHAEAELYKMRWTEKTSELARVGRMSMTNVQRANQRAEDSQEQIRRLKDRVEKLRQQKASAQQTEREKLASTREELTKRNKEAQAALKEAEKRIGELERSLKDVCDDVDRTKEVEIPGLQRSLDLERKRLRDAEDLLGPEGKRCKTCHPFVVDLVDDDDDDGSQARVDGTMKDESEGMQEEQSQ